jgi:hypothetical protein
LVGTGNLTHLKGLLPFSAGQRSRKNEDAAAKEAELKSINTTKRAKAQEQVSFVVGLIERIANPFANSEPAICFRVSTFCALADHRRR